MVARLSGGGDALIHKSDTYNQAFRISGGGGNNDELIEDTGTPSQMLGSESVVGFEGGQQTTGIFGALVAFETVMQNTGTLNGFNKVEIIYDQINP